MLSVDLFAEDSAHEVIVRSIVNRVLKEAKLRFQIQVRNASGGHGKAISELKLYQIAVRNVLPTPDLLVVVIDANCKGYVQSRNAIEQEVDKSLAGDLLVACPDPHVERWLFADPVAFGRVVGIAPVRERRKCDRNHYKTLLRQTVQESGHYPTLGGLEFAKDIVDEMNLVTSGRNEPSLGHLLRGLKAFGSRHK